MGRKPNAVVAEFFARGKKLEDSSNRYQHTCRKCGQLFSKGRVDKLQSHLLKKCPNVTQAERNAVLLAMQHQQQQSSANKTTRNNQIVPLNGFNSLQPTGSQALAMPVSLDRQQSALDTLAEVSRRHLDYSSQRDAVFDQHNLLPQDASDQLLAEQALWAQLRQHTMDLNVPHNQHDLFQLTNQQRGMSSAEDFASNLATSNPNAAQLMSNNQHDLQAMTTLDPQLDVEHHHLNLSDHVNVAVMPETSMHQDAQSDDNVQNALMPWTSDLHTSAVAIPNTTEDANTNGNHPPLKPRARFSDTRRKEVSETRKRGACIRCRMLKKPCSDGTPCTTCAKVDTARLWKTHCIRSKLSEMFKAWDHGLFEVQSGRQLPHVIQRCLLDPGEFNISITFTTTTAAVHILNLSLPAHAYSPNSDQSVVVTGFHRSYINMMSQGQIFLMKPENGDIKQLSDRLLAPEVVNAAIEAESHPFYRRTLQQAQVLLQQSNLIQNNEQNKTRTSYSLSDSLIQNVLELWIITAVLTNAHIDGRATSPDLSVGFSFTIYADNTVVAELSEVSNTAAHQILELQILAELETRCAKLSKTVMNDIERHLLQRQSVSGFSTFITAMVLLFCIERTTDFFHKREQWHHEYSIPDTGHNPNWPIDASARDIWQQGPAFAALLRMLLYMRGLPPRTYKNENGMMAVIDEPELGITKANGNAKVSQVRALDEQRRAAMIEWMERCNVSYDEVNSWLDEGRESWQGKFVAGLLISTRSDSE